MTGRNNLLDLTPKFFIGSNYWASHAGTDMWKDWRPEEVDADFAALAEAGIDVIRVFPLWPDFQPITGLYGSFGRYVDSRFIEARRPSSASGKAGVSDVMMERFRLLCAMAQQHGIKVIVALVTGYMSGRLFVPPVLAGREILTDPVSIYWQVRFVSHFVEVFKEEGAIVAWDLGNECNEMGKVGSREAAFVWTSAIANAVKSRDATRPLISGMHQLSPAGQWTMQDQGDLTDILTTHPYPFWTRFADYDGMDGMRSALHATVESLFYGEIGNKPCFAEELGTMGPMVCCDETAATFARLTMLSLWAHGTDGLLWWCSSDQTELNQAPYDWIACEGELGLLRNDRSAKPVLRELGRIKARIGALPFAKLPSRSIDAVCVLNSTQDHWAVAYGTFLLAKQAGLDVAFCYEDQPIPEASTYLLPCVTGVAGVPKPLWNELLKRTRAGATLYVSSNDGYMLNFVDVTGLRVKNRSRRAKPAVVAVDEAPGPGLEFAGDFRLELANERAEILYAEEDGNPVVSRCAYGSGKVMFCALPLELTFIAKTGASRDPSAFPFWRIYEAMSKTIVRERTVHVAGQNLSVTEHRDGPDAAYVVIINYGREDQHVELRMEDGWAIKSSLYPAAVLADILLSGTDAPNAIRIAKAECVILMTVRRCGEQMVE